MLSYHKGIIISWNDERGFGFIEPEDKSKNVFVHISVIKQGTRRPKVGDVIHYQLTMDQEGRLRASNAYIENIEYMTVEQHPFPAAQGNDVHYYPAPRNVIKQWTFQQGNHRKESKSSTWIYRFISILGLILIGVYGTDYFSSHHQDDSVEYSTKYSTNSLSQRYTCSGKTRCSQMNSCEEATFYLRNCPGVEIDGDGDGIPCESQWCGN